uniref:Polypeptide N-acetylgalactosaminyltransferase n=1 Tax=Leptobrachium leishanense TaxID=445787 RepID=A0A8C5PFC9_9ANUR
MSYKTTISMLLRKRWKSRLCQLQILVLVLGLLALLVMMIAVLDPETQTEGKSRDLQQPYEDVNHGWPAVGMFLERSDDDDHGHQYEVEEVLFPLSSFRDEGLIAMRMPEPARSLDRMRRKMYRIVGQPKKKNVNEIPTPVTPRVHALNRHEYDMPASQIIPLHRTLPEGRHPFCLRQKYSEKLPRASIIISFHNEAWSTLLRTVHSVLDHSPRNVLQEIILVDDLSQQGHLKSSLSEYVSRIGGVKLIRSNKRLGTFGAHKLGAARATGEVLVFMESHCECHKGWLEPLLDRIMGSRNRIVSPVLDIIDRRTLEYYHSADLRRAVFDWNLDFHWAALPEDEEKVRQSPIIPFRSPVIAGYVMAVDRHYFQNIGGFDTGSSFQGVENLELSIRVWLCGGSVEIIPCSRIGHVIQNHTRFTSHPDDVVLRNKIRIAEVWMDSYKDIFYKHIGKALLMTKIEKLEIAEREQLRLRLGCNGFQWFLHNIYSGINSSYSMSGSSGQMFNIGAGFCMDYKCNQVISGQPIELSSCEDTITQVFQYIQKEITNQKSSRSLCLDVRHEQVILINCALQQKPLWDFSGEGLIKHIPSGKCMEPASMKTGTTLHLTPCNHKPVQLWKIIPI